MGSSIGYLATNTYLVDQFYILTRSLLSMPFSTFCRQTVSLFFVCLSASFFPLVAQSVPTANPPTSLSVAPNDTLGQMLEAERKRTLDPVLGRVPSERLEAIRSQQITASKNGTSTLSGIPNVSWQERGPSNAGGRTRALLFDPNDASHKKVWAGSVTGGLWFNPDITDANSGWTPVSDDWQNTFITALAADPSNPQVMYAGTGDIYDYRPGGGIWKTTDGGLSWARLSSAIPGSSYPGVNTALRYIQRIAVNSSGHVFVATQYGVVRSTDGGNSWAYTLAPAQSIGASGSSTNVYNDLVTDLEIGSDGAVYAAFYPTKLYKSANGTTWTDITPAGSAIGDRTELALAPSTSGAAQVVYAVTRKYNSVNYAQDVLWFKKSVDAGATWSDLVIPGSSSTSNFTSGNGYYALSLGVSPTDPNTVYAGGYNWFRSINGGSSWSQLSFDYVYQHGFAFQPGTTNAAIFNEKGAFWSIDWGNPAVVAQPTLADRNAGYRAGETNSVAMKSSPGSPYLLNTTRPLGVSKLTQTGLSAGSVFYQTTYDGGVTFIDEEDPSVQIFAQYSYYVYDGSNLQYLFSPNRSYAINATDYDSPANILYAADFYNNTYSIRRVTGIGSGSYTTTYLPLTGFTDLASCIKLSKDRSALFVGTYPGKLYKMTGLDQSTPTLTAIDNNAFTQYTTISGIDVGATDSELVVTLSNFGTKSVWYTNNGGTTWTSKDEPAYGLPDMPIRSVLINPQNYKQVLLGTEVGVWSSNDITASNPDWSFSNAGLGNFRVNQLRYRASDGRMAAATTGRGVFTSDIFAIPYTLPSVTLTGVSTNQLCAGSTFSVSFSTNGPAFVASNRFEVWISDAAGSFANAKKIGSGAASPVSATLASGYSALPYGTNYRVKIIATNPDVESSQSDALAIGNLGNASVYDRRSDASQNYSSGTICPGSSVTLRAFGRDVNYNTITPDSYSWSLNGAIINGATSATVSAQQAGNYTATVKQAGCSVTSTAYTLSTSSSIYSSVLSKANGEPQCDDHPLKLYSGYIGETATYQWTRDGIAISGANAYTTSANQTGNYICQVVDGSCVITASPTYFKFGRSLYARAYLNNMADSLICSGYSVSMYADFPQSNDYTVQWYLNGIALPNQTNQYYYPYQAGIYTFLLRQGSCQTFSNPVVLYGDNQFRASISYSYRTKTACPGETRYLYANPSNNGSFQWQKDGVDISGATNYYYGATQSGNYTVRLTRGSCSVTAAPLSLTFGNAIQPMVYTYSSGLDACSNIYLNAGDSYNLNGYQYQWYRNGVPVNNATNNYYYASQSGAYSARVTNAGCTGLSKEVYANVGNGKTAKPVISIASNTSRLCANNVTQLSGNFTSGAIQWKRNGVPIPNETFSRLYATQSGIYSVVVQDGSCQAESDPVEIKIGEASTAQIAGSYLVEAGKTANLPVSFTGPAPWSFTLSNGQSVTATYQNPTLVPVAPTTSTTYQLASVINACGTVAASGQAVVAVGTGSADLSLAMAVSNRTPAINAVIDCSVIINNASIQDAQGVQAKLLLPNGVVLTDVVSAGVSSVGNVVTVDAGTIAANSTGAFVFRIKATQSGTFATSAQITASQTPDPDSQPNSGTGDGEDDAATIDLRTADFVPQLSASANPNQLPLPRVSGNQPTVSAATADISLTMNLDKQTVSITKNEVITATITVSNQGGATANSVIVSVNLPNGYFDYQNSSVWQQVNNQTYKVYVNQLPAGQSATVLLRWQPVGSGTLKAQIFDMAETDPDSTPGNGDSTGEDDEASASVRMR